jgi:hypothetical protein
MSNASKIIIHKSKWEIVQVIAPGVKMAQKVFLQVVEL